MVPFFLIQIRKPILLSVLVIHFLHYDTYLRKLTEEKKDLLWLVVSEVLASGGKKKALLEQSCLYHGNHEAGVNACQGTVISTPFSIWTLSLQDAKAHI